MPCIKCRECCALLSLAGGNFQTPDAMALILIFFWLLRPPCLHPPIVSWDSESLTPSPWKLSRYLVTEGGTQSSLVHSITHRRGSVGIEFKKKQKESNF